MHSKDELRYEGTKGHMLWLDNPEVRLVANLVFVTKLLHPMDDVPRFARSAEDATPFRINWKIWKEVHSRPCDEAERLERRDLYNIGPEDVGEMTERQLDDYLAWYQQSEVKKEGGESHSKFFIPSSFPC